MLFKLTVPVPAKHLNGQDIYNRHYYFEGRISPTRREVLATLNHQLEMIDSGNIIFNGYDAKRDLEIAVEQIETISDYDFPEVSQMGYVSSCNVETRFGTKRLTLAMIVPMRIKHGNFKKTYPTRTENFSEEIREPLTVKYE